MLLWHNCLDNVITPIYLDHLAHLILSGTCHNLGWSCVIKSCHHLKNCHHLGWRCHHLGWRRHRLGCDRDEKLYTVSHHLGRSPPSLPPGEISRENRFRTVRQRHKDMVVRLGWDAAMPSKMSTDQHLPSCGFSTTCDLAGDIFVERTQLWPYLVSPDKYPGTACNIQAGRPSPRNFQPFNESCTFHRCYECIFWRFCVHFCAALYAKNYSLLWIVYLQV